MKLTINTTENSNAYGTGSYNQTNIVRTHVIDIPDEDIVELLGRLLASKKEVVKDLLKSGQHGEASKEA